MLAELRFNSPGAVRRLPPIVRRVCRSLNVPGR